MELEPGQTAPEPTHSHEWVPNLAGCHGQLRSDLVYSTGGPVPWLLCAVRWAYLKGPTGVSELGPWAAGKERPFMPRFLPDRISLVREELANFLTHGQV